MTRQALSFEVGVVNGDKYLAISERGPLFCFIKDTEDEVISLARQAFREYAEFKQTRVFSRPSKQQDVQITQFRGRTITLDNAVSA